MPAPRAFWVLLAAALAAGCKAPARLGSFRNISLETFDGARTVSLAACPTPRCLAVYVAPWCHYCRAATPMIRALRGVLRQRSMDSWVIVGLDQEAALRAYARDFGEGTLVDVERAIDPGGVPHFFLIDNTGLVVRHVAGLPPDPSELLAFALKP